MASAYITAHLGHLERVQSLGVTHVDPHCLLLVLHVGFLVFYLNTNDHLNQLNHHISLQPRYCPDMTAVPNCGRVFAYITGEVPGSFGCFDTQVIQASFTGLRLVFFPLLLIFNLQQQIQTKTEHLWS